MLIIYIVLKFLTKNVPSLIVSASLVEHVIHGSSLHFAYFVEISHKLSIPHWFCILGGDFSEIVHPTLKIDGGEEAFKNNI